MTTVSDLNSVLMILIPIGVAFAIGQLLFRTRGETAVEAYSLIGAATGTFWVGVGVFMIVGGLELVGMVVIIFFFYLARGNWRRFQTERSTRASIAGGGS